MATVTKRPSSPPPAPAKHAQARAEGPAVLRAFDAIYHFLASLKLAVISLASLAAVLAAGTYVESRYGTVAVQEWVYQSWWFAILLAFLATNILCAALIRYPWTKRQTGFVITHAGLLLVLAGSFWSFRQSDEGRVSLTEGEQTDQLIRPDHPVIRVREVDPHTRKPVENYDYELPFRPGPRAWSAGRYELLTDGTAPFKLAVKDHLTASAPRYIHEEVTGGRPMIALGLFFKAPNMLRESDMFEGDIDDPSRWLIADNRAMHAARSIGMQAQLSFQYLDSEEKLQQFLNPPPELGKAEFALIHYTDRAGKPRVETWELGPAAKVGESRQLPDSDLTLRFAETSELPPGHGMDSLAGDEGVGIAVFKAREGQGQEFSLFGWAGLPMLESFIPGLSGPESVQPKQAIHVDYYRPLGGGRMGSIEVAGMPDGRLFYRTLNRNGLKQPPAPLKLGERVPALGGNGSPMSASLRVDRFLTSGRERRTLEQIDLPVGELEKGIPAALVEISSGDETRQLWVRKTGGFDPHYEFVSLPGGKAFEVAYDVDRAPMGFTVALDDFDRGNDPGTSNDSSYQSEIRLTDEEQGIKDKHISIYMNHTMTHRGWTFYQANFEKVLDPQTGEPTGRFMSVFQVGHDPGRPLKYGGCLLVILGAFVQFYMRAGLFSDGGKRERARAEVKAAKLAAKANGQASTPAKESAAAAPAAEEELL